MENMPFENKEHRQDTHELREEDRIFFECRVDEANDHFIHLGEKLRSLLLQAKTQEELDALAAAYKHLENEIKVWGNTIMEEIDGEKDRPLYEYEKGAEWRLQKKRQLLSWKMYIHDLNGYLSGTYISFIPYLAKNNTEIITSEKKEEWKKNAMDILQNKWAEKLEELISSTRGLKPREYSLGNLLEKEVEDDSFQGSMDQKNITLVFPEEDTKIFTEYRFMQIILRNLLQNARKFVSENGEISINIQQQGEDIEVSIIDNGIGMSEEKRSSIQEIFDGYDQTIKSSQGTNGEKGTGEGLRGCAELAELLGIKVKIQSSDKEEDHGTTFVLKIPATYKRYRQIVKKKEMAPKEVLKLDTVSETKQAVAKKVKNQVASLSVNKLGLQET